ncbi:MAG: hypothetical protein AAB356_06345 [Deltaproteobacteria bacterium]
MSNEITKPDAALAAGSHQRGFEGGITQEDLIIPRAKLIQALSPEITEGLGVKPGAIINSLTKEVLPDEFIPIFMFKNYIRFNPRSKADPNFDSAYEPGAVIWKSTDSEDPKVLSETRFGPNGEKPIATTFLNFFSCFPGVPMPVIVSFSKTSYKAGRQLLSLAKFCGGDMFSRKYRLASLMETNDIATYAVFKVAPAGAVSPDEYKLCERLWNDFSEKAKDIQVHEEGTADEPVPF